MTHVASREDALDHDGRHRLARAWPPTSGTRGLEFEVPGTAAGAALESARYKSGVFTFALLEALKERRGDVDRDGDITATELVRYVRARVEALTGGKQRPVTRGENLDLDFSIHGRAPTCAGSCA